MPEDGGDDRGPAAQGEQAKRGAGDGHAAVEVGDGGTHGGEVHEVGDATQCVGGSDKGDACTRPRKQAVGFQATEGVSEVWSTDTAHEFVELRQCIVRDLVRLELAAACDHFLAGEPDTQVPELDVPLPIDPPQEAEDLTVSNTKPPCGFCAERVAYAIVVDGMDRSHWL